MSHHEINLISSSFGLGVALCGTGWCFAINKKSWAGFNLVLLLANAALLYLEVVR